MATYASYSAACDACDRMIADMPSIHEMQETGWYIGPRAEHETDENAGRHSLCPDCAPAADEYQEEHQ